MTDLEREILDNVLELGRAFHEFNGITEGWDQGCRIGATGERAVLERERIARGRLLWAARVYADVQDGRLAGLTGPVVW